MNKISYIKREIKTTYDDKDTNLKVNEWFVLIVWYIKYHSCQVIKWIGFEVQSFILRIQSSVEMDFVLGDFDLMASLNWTSEQVFDFAPELVWDWVLYAYFLGYLFQQLSFEDLNILCLIHYLQINA